MALQIQIFIREQVLCLQLIFSSARQGLDSKRRASSNWNWTFYWCEKHIHACMNTSQVVPSQSRTRGKSHPVSTGVNHLVPCTCWSTHVNFNYLLFQHNCNSNSIGGESTPDLTGTERIWPSSTGSDPVYWNFNCNKKLKYLLIDINF